MTTNIIDTQSIVATATGEKLLWVEWLSDGTVTLNDSGAGIPIDYDTIDLADEARQWLTAVGADITDDGDVYLDDVRLTVHRA